MKKFLYIIHLLCILISNFSCEVEKNIINPEKIQPAIHSTVEELRQTIKIELVDYDSLQVSNKPSARLEEKLVSRIEFGEKETGEFVSDQMISPSYNDTIGNYNFYFSVSKKIENTYLRAYYFTLRFILHDSSIVEIDTLALLYKYPYESTEIFLKTAEHFGLKAHDFEIIGDDIYFINSSNGLYKYNQITEKLDKLHNLTSTYFLTGNSEYLFWDKLGKYINRYNISLGTVDYVYNVSSYGHQINGIAFYQNQLYAYINGTGIAVYDIGGQLRDTISILYGHLSFIHNDIIYFEGDHMLKLYNLETNRTMYDIRAPSAHYFLRMKVYAQKLYFLDRTRQIICVVPCLDII